MKDVGFYIFSLAAIFMIGAVFGNCADVMGSEKVCRHSCEKHHHVFSRLDTQRGCICGDEVRP